MIKNYLNKNYIFISIKMSFIYSLIANEKKVVLAEYSEYSGNFSQIVRSILTKIVKEGKFIVNYDK